MMPIHPPFLTGTWELAPTHTSPSLAFPVAPLLVEEILDEMAREQAIRNLGHNPKPGHKVPPLPKWSVTLGGGLTQSSKSMMQDFLIRIRFPLFCGKQTYSPQLTLPSPFQESRARGRVLPNQKSQI
jgi:hypothetical protein